MTPEIRAARAEDLEAICQLDHIARVGDANRRRFIAQAVAAGECHVLIDGGVLAAYAVLNYSFYACGFIALLYVAADERRRAQGTRLMRHMEAVCRTPKLFTSTNLSNLPMQALLAKLGYELSGVIHNLDEGDPELVYFKLVR